MLLFFFTSILNFLLFSLQFLFFFFILISVGLVACFWWIQFFFFCYSIFYIIIVVVVLVLLHITYISTYVCIQCKLSSHSVMHMIVSCPCFYTSIFIFIFFFFGSSCVFLWPMEIATEALRKCFSLLMVDYCHIKIAYFSYFSQKKNPKKKKT